MLWYSGTGTAHFPKALALGKSAVGVADYALGWAGGDCPISCFFRHLSCVVLSALSVHPPDFTSRVCVCLFVCLSVTGSRRLKTRVLSTRTPHEYRTFCYIG